MGDSYFVRTQKKAAWKFYPTGSFWGESDGGRRTPLAHYDDVIMTMLASQITSLTVVYSSVYSGVNQRKHQSSASLAFVREIHRGPVNFPHKWLVTRKMFPFDDVIMRGQKHRTHFHVVPPLCITFSQWMAIGCIGPHGRHARLRVRAELGRRRGNVMARFSEEGAVWARRQSRRNATSHPAQVGV